MFAVVLIPPSELRTESRSVSRFAGQRIHFIGIGGSGMSGLANMLLDAGAIVSGTDLKLSEQTLHLQQRGAAVATQQDGAMINRELDLVVRTAAVPDTNPEFQAACRLKVPHLKYAQLLGRVMAERFGIAVAGTHGKSTTTSMISYALLECGADPSFVIGATVGQLGGGSRSGRGNAFVVEACEYDRSFHNLHPTVAIINNIEKDHLDCYTGGLPQIIESFRKFARLVPAGGRIIANGQDENVALALKGLKRRIEWVGLVGGERPAVANRRAANWQTHVTGADNGCYRGDVFCNGLPVAALKLRVAGEHNLYNATVAIAAAAAAGISPQNAADAIGGFVGVDRRMTQVGAYRGAIIVDDYGHHPTEISKTLTALRQRYNPRRLICVFQPHQASRTRLLLDEFEKCFLAADIVLISDIYFVRDSEEERRSIHSRDLVERIRITGTDARYVPTFEQIEEQLRQIAGEGDLVLTIGAGPIFEIGRRLAGH